MQDHRLRRWPNIKPNIDLTSCVCSDVDCNNCRTIYVIDLKEAFDVFDRANEGVITPGKLGSVLRSLGEDFTEAEIQDLIFAVDENGKININ